MRRILERAVTIPASNYGKKNFTIFWHSAAIYQWTVNGTNRLDYCHKNKAHVKLCILVPFLCNAAVYTSCSITLNRVVFATLLQYVESQINITSLCGRRFGGNVCYK